MPIEVHTLTLGALQTNCYVVADTAIKKAIIIDPADEASKILALIKDGGYQVCEILATHAHFDHVLASQPLKAATGALFRLHSYDVGQLKNAQQIAAMFGIDAPDAAAHDGTVNEGDFIEVGAIKLETFFTPGHSPGHVIFVLRSEQLVFGGDCLFAGSIGRTDLPGGDYATLLTSIFEKILPLGDAFTIYPGHGPATTIAQERLYNPFLLSWR
jgi:hydroxyacylglutathione hydrolase